MTLTPMRAAVLGCFLVFTGGETRAMAAAIIEPIGPGEFAVGSTNFEVNPKPDGPMIDYLKGAVTPQGRRYVGDILTHPESVLMTGVDLPAGDAALGRLAGKRLPVAIYVLYPTPADKSRAAYRFPYQDTGDNEFPHMQAPGDKPLLAGAAGKRWPLIIYSTGFEAHGLWDLEHLKRLASHGYIVASVFYSDGRMSFDMGLRVRPLEQRAVLDYLLAHPDFGLAIDPERIGVSGGSFGGYTALTIMGGRYLGDASPPADPRVKAGFGLVPFTGARMGWWPFSFESWPFGKDFAGLRAVKAPFLAVYAGKDKNVPVDCVERSLAQLGGPTLGVKLEGEQHLLSKAVWSDVYTWEVLFFDTWLKGDAEARRKLYSANSVMGGVNDHRTVLRAGDGLRE